MAAHFMAEKAETLLLTSAASISEMVIVSCPNSQVMQQSVSSWIFEPFLALSIVGFLCSALHK
jgi:hypothetical protein